jgi:hypothetical protein
MSTSDSNTQSICRDTHESGFEYSCTVGILLPRLSILPTEHCVRFLGRSTKLDPWSRVCGVVLLHHPALVTRRCFMLPRRCLLSCLFLHGRGWSHTKAIKTSVSACR